MTDPVHASKRVDCAYFESRQAARAAGQANVNAMIHGFCLGMALVGLIESISRREIALERRRRAQLDLANARVDEAAAAAEAMAEAAADAGDGGD